MFNVNLGIIFFQQFILYQQEVSRREPERSILGFSNDFPTVCLWFGGTPFKRAMVRYGTTNFAWVALPTKNVTYPGNGPVEGTNVWRAY